MSQKRVAPIYRHNFGECCSVVTKAVYPETEKAPGFEAVAFETEAVDPKTEAARQYVNKSRMCTVYLTRRQTNIFFHRPN